MFTVFNVVNLNNYLWLWTHCGLDLHSCIWQRFALHSSIPYLSVLTVPVESNLWPLCCERCGPLFELQEGCRWSLPHDGLLWFSLMSLVESLEEIHSILKHRDLSVKCIAGHAAGIWLSGELHHTAGDAVCVRRRDTGPAVHPAGLLSSLLSRRETLLQVKNIHASKPPETMFIPSLSPSETTQNTGVDKPVHHHI